jgi:hypothetical protein
LAEAGSSSGAGPVELYATHPAMPGGLRVSCARGAQVEPLDTAAERPPSCTRPAALEVAVPPAEAHAHLVVVGVDAAWTEIPSAPASAAGQAEMRLPLAAEQRPGPLRIYVLSATRSLTAGEVHAALQKLRLKTERLTSPAAETLPLGRPDVVQRSVLVEIR